jgi:predicted transcriptional regulator
MSEVKDTAAAVFLDACLSLTKRLVLENLVQATDAPKVIAIAADVLINGHEALVARLAGEVLATAASKPAAQVPAFVAAVTAVPTNPKARNVEPTKEQEQAKADAAFRAKYPIAKGVTVKNSQGSELLTVLMDGKRLKMIKRYLEANYGITFEDYKRIYGLPEDYPSCTSSYRAIRKGHALNQGLGTLRVPKGSRSPSTSNVEQLKAVKEAMETPLTLARKRGRPAKVAVAA